MMYLTQNIEQTRRVELRNVRPIVYLHPCKQTKGKLMLVVSCSYCELPAVSASDAPEGGAYAPVCASDLARLVADFGDVEVALRPQSEDCLCGCQ